MIKKTIAKILKDFFSNLVKSLLIKLPNASNKYNIESVFQYYSKFIIEKPFHLTLTSQEEVFRIIRNIDISKAAGIDHLSGKILKDRAEILAKPLSVICNLSITSRAFPNACKVAKLRPIFKKSKKTDPSNYRPISLLPLILKVLERVIHDQTNTFLKGNNLLYNYQSGFRTSHSTNLCLSFLTDEILKDFDEGLLTGMILIDHQKAFDTINHKILFKKFKAMVFSEGCITWFQSYLFERILFISTENQLSDYVRILCGVLQDTILGPSLFLIYVNDMPQAVNSNLFLYVDDSCLMFQHIKKLKKLRGY